MRKKKPLPEGDVAELNMTPMIDIVFNLVTFFMLTLDMTQKDLAKVNLPRATQGVEDKDPSTLDEKTTPIWERTRLIINLENNTKDAKVKDSYNGTGIYFKGRRYPLQDVPLDVQAKGLDDLKNEIKAFQREPRHAKELEDPAIPGASRMMVLLRADRETKWQYVQWIMQVCADAGIYRLHFAIEHPPKE